MRDSVIFDMDGVIFDSERLYNDAWRLVGHKLGLKDIETCITHCVGLNGRDIRAYLLDHYGGAFPAEQFSEEIKQTFDALVSDGGLPLKTGVRKILTWLSGSDITIGLATSTSRSNAVRHLENAGLLPYFKAVATGDMTKNGKPDPEIYHLACSMLGVKPESSFAIEDSPNGIRSAHDAGLKVIMVPDMISPTPDIEQLLYKKFDSLLDVKAYFESL